MQENMRWIFRKKNFPYKIILIILSSILSILFYFKFNNIVVGTFFLFMLSYFLGFFKGRKRVEIQHNRNISSALTALCKLIDNSSASVNILSGSLNPAIYNQEDMVSCLSKAKGRNVRIKIICESNKFIDTYRTYIQKDKMPGILKLVESQRIELYLINRALGDINHFAIIDGVSFRLEKIHKNNSDRKAIIVYKSKKAKTLQDLFNKVLQRKDTVPVLSTEIWKILNKQQ